MAFIVITSRLISLTSLHYGQRLGLAGTYLTYQWNYYYNPSILTTYPVMKGLQSLAVLFIVDLSKIWHLQWLDSY